MLLGSARLRGRRHLIPALIPIAALIAFSLNAVPARADVAVSGTCLVTATLTFNTAITAVPSLTRYQIAGNNTSPCVSTPPSATAAFLVQGSAIASCDWVMTMFGAGAFNVTGQTANVSLSTSSGETDAQQWDFPGTDPASFDATATLAWENLTEIQNCYLHGGTTTMTLTGTLTYVGESLA